MVEEDGGGQIRKRGDQWDVTHEQSLAIAGFEDGGTWRKAGQEPRTAGVLQKLRAIPA